MLNKMFVAVATLALMAEGASATGLAIKNIANHIMDTNGEVAQDVGTIMNFQVVYDDLSEGSKGVEYHSCRACLTLATEGSVIDNAIYTKATTTKLQFSDKRNTAKVVTGICESQKAVEDMFSEISKSSENRGAIIEGLNGSKVLKRAPRFYPNLQMALRATELLAEYQDWQVAVLFPNGGGAMAIHFTATSRYCITAWGDLVIYKAWVPGDRYGKSWNVSPLTVDNENNILVLDRTPTN